MSDASVRFDFRWPELFAFAARRYFFQDVELTGIKKIARKLAASIPPIDGGTHDAARDGAGARSEPERHASEDEGKGGHQDWSQTKPRAFERSIKKGFTFFVFVLREFDCGDGVFCG